MSGLGNNAAPAPAGWEREMAALRGQIARLSNGLIVLTGVVEDLSALVRRLRRRYRRVGAFAAATGIQLDEVVGVLREGAPGARGAPGRPGRGAPRRGRPRGRGGRGRGRRA